MLDRGAAIARDLQDGVPGVRLTAAAGRAGIDVPRPALFVRDEDESPAMSQEPTASSQQPIADSR